MIVSQTQKAIVMYTPSAFGGHARYTHELLSEIARCVDAKHLTVALATASDLAPEFQSSLYPIFRVVPPLVPAEEYGDAVEWAARRFFYFTQRERVFAQWVKDSPTWNAIHFQEYTPWLAPIHLHRFKHWGKKLFFTVHNIRPHEYLPGIPEFVQDEWMRNAWRHCDLLFVHTQGLRVELERFLGPEHPPITVAHHGAWISPEASRRDAPARERAGRKRLLFFGTIRRDKGLEVLVRSMRQLDDYTLCIAGKAEDESLVMEAREAIKALPAHQVEFVNRYVNDEELPALFRQSSALILPYTHFSSQSGVLFLAITYGLPVVATTVGALGETVSDYGLGLTVEPGDEQALAAAIRRVHEASVYDEVLRNLYNARERFSWRQVAKEVVDAYLTNTVWSGSADPS